LRIHTTYLLLLIFAAGILLPAMISISLLLHKESVFDSSDYEGERATTLSFSASQYAALNWNDGNEFIYNDQHYDLSSIHKKGNIYIVSCLSDQKEDQLISKLDKTSAEKHTVKKVVFNWMVFNYPYTDSSLLIYVTCFIQPKGFFHPWNDAPRSITTPPPRFMSC